MWRQEGRRRGWWRFVNEFCFWRGRNFFSPFFSPFDCLFQSALSSFSGIKIERMDAADRLRQALDRLVYLPSLTSSSPSPSASSAALAAVAAAARERRRRGREAGTGTTTKGESDFPPPPPRPWDRNDLFRVHPNTPPPPSTQEPRVPCHLEVGEIRLALGRVVEARRCLVGHLLIGLGALGGGDL